MFGVIKQMLAVSIKLSIYKIRFAHVGLLQSVVPEIFLKNKGMQIEENVVFHNWKNLKSIGNHTYIGKNTFFDSVESIGSYCSISHDVKIGLRNHKLDSISSSPYFYSEDKGWVSQDQSPKQLPVIIGHDVLISANAVIMAGVTVGHGAVIGAGSVVTKNVEPYSIVGGVPAKTIRMRFELEVIKSLIDSQWWELDFNKIKDLEMLFNFPLEFVKNLKKGEV